MWAEGGLAKDDAGDSAPDGEDGADGEVLLRLATEDSAPDGDCADGEVLLRLATEDSAPDGAGGNEGDCADGAGGDCAGIFFFEGGGNLQPF